MPIFINDTIFEGNPSNEEKPKKINKRGKPDSKVEEKPLNAVQKSLTLKNSQYLKDIFHRGEK